MSSPDSKEDNEKLLKEILEGEKEKEPFSLRSFIQVRFFHMFPYCLFLGSVNLRCSRSRITNSILQKKKRGIDMRSDLQFKINEFICYGLVMIIRYSSFQNCKNNNRK